jgi:hypothetical protein
MKMLSLIASLIVLSTPLPALAQSRALGAAEALAQTAPEYHRGVVRHLVTFRFKAGVTGAQVEEVVRRFLALKTACRRDGREYIRSIEAGRANSPEGADQGQQVGFLVTFGSEGDRNYYVGAPLIDPGMPQFFDPAHAEFKGFVGGLLATPVVPNGVFVFDFTVTRRNR